MKIISAAFIFLIVASYASANSCPKKMESLAYDSVVGVDSWRQLNVFYDQFVSCDDGYIAEAISQKVAFLLINNFDGLLSYESNSDHDNFLNFVLLHVDETYTFEDYKKVVLSHQAYCGDSKECLCAKLRKRLSD